MKIVKQNKTTSAAIVFLLAGLGLTAALIFGKIDSSTYQSSLLGLGTFATLIIGFFAADSKTK